ncbi:hypothetical protein OH779_30435 [Actinacidiphila glaucinigra]|uniref:hypothetical protein n=1 Tax=Actinacidiphila glaucinigra TaxID=235986 RepID=UPI00386AD07C
MITPIDGPDEERDPELSALLGPGTVLLGPPPGRFREVRRAAARRRLLRTAAGAGVSLAVAAVVAVPLHLLSSPGQGPAVGPNVPAVSVPPAADPPPSPPPTTSPVPEPSESHGPDRRTGSPDPRRTGSTDPGRAASTARQSRSVSATPLGGPREDAPAVSQR